MHIRSAGGCLALPQQRTCVRHGFREDVRMPAHSPDPATGVGGTHTADVSLAQQQGAGTTPSQRPTACGRPATQNQEGRDVCALSPHPPQTPRTHTPFEGCTGYSRRPGTAQLLRAPGVGARRPGRQLPGSCLLVQRKSMPLDRLRMNMVGFLVSALAACSGAGGGREGGGVSRGPRWHPTVRTGAGGTDAGARGEAARRPQQALGQERAGAAGRQAGGWRAGLAAVWPAGRAGRRARLHRHHGRLPGGGLRGAHHAALRQRLQGGAACVLASAVGGVGSVHEACEGEGSGVFVGAGGWAAARGGGGGGVAAWTPPASPA